MITRSIETILQTRLTEEAAVVLTGPRQAGKTTLALKLCETHSGMYLDLESPSDLAKLSEPELYLEPRMDRLVVLDEVHHRPDLFPVLRGLIDRALRGGRRKGLYLLLGSASFDLLRQSGESLAGRVSYLELGPFNLMETKDTGGGMDRLWLRGGFPESCLAESDDQSTRRRKDFIRTYLERDIPQFGASLPRETLRRLWIMIGHRQCSIHNASVLSRSLGLDVRTINRYTDLLSDLFLIRRLPAWHQNTGKRLIKSPKLYIRDSGILHTLLGLNTMDQLLSHPVAGQSWEGFVIEQVLACAPMDSQGFFYRTSGGAEIDLLLMQPDGTLWAIEIKRSLSPKPGRGFYSACEDVKPERRYIVYPGDSSFPVSADTEAVSLQSLLELLSD